MSPPTTSKYSKRDPRGRKLEVTPPMREFIVAAYRARLGTQQRIASFVGCTQKTISLILTEEL